jgi:hypothetical protein
MKVYVVLVDYRGGHDTKVYGVYKQYRHARQEALRLLDVSKDIGIFHQIANVRVVNQEVTE